MAPAQHLAWFEDNINWFGALAVDSLDQDVPNCPGWTVEDLLNHLTFGLGVGYPIGLRAAPDAKEADVWRELSLPKLLPAGRAAIESFTANMTDCLNTFRGVDPERPCWTYAGPGRARFWFRRAAIETTLHRMDVAEGLGTASFLHEDRLVDAIDETIGFALPFAAQICGADNRAVAIDITEPAAGWTIGDGQPAATIWGPGIAVLDALWGRNLDRVNVSGDPAIADSWLSMVSTAFAGR